ncbi:MAG: SMC-Scp complex subunit ScpB [Candidatus Thermoplasmatota archaeon]|jgi:segregation and condensation protein B|nr:SMC-Scp complex subunit ScpB [Candidatus Thermoplasmatota archaeon]MCL5790690.1 SMC-Scp complex subunit ScpB [Candidatus Thermoplasmatota archaeon]
MELRGKIEAILFATEEPIGVVEISSILMVKPEEAKRELNRIIRDYKRSEQPMEVIITGKKYRMGLKPEYREVAFPVAKKEISGDEMEAMTLILNSTKTMRGTLREKFGDRTDEISRNLKKMGFIRTEKYRNTEIYSLTNKFYRYFGITRKMMAIDLEAEDEKTGEEQ